MFHRVGHTDMREYKLPKSMRYSAKQPLVSLYEQSKPGRDLAGLHSEAVPVDLARPQGDHTAGANQLTGHRHQLHHQQGEGHGGHHGGNTLVSCKTI